MFACLFPMSTLQRCLMGVFELRGWCQSSVGHGHRINDFCYVNQCLLLYVVDCSGLRATVCDSEMSEKYYFLEEEKNEDRKETKTTVI
jgi:hypothetical protein